MEVIDGCHLAFVPCGEYILIGLTLHNFSEVTVHGHALAKIVVH